MYFNYNFQISPWYSVKWKSPTQMYHVCMRAKSLPSCLTFYDPMDCSPPGSSILGILQAWILECVAMPFSRGSSRPRDWTCVCYHILRWQVGSLPLVPSTFYFSGALRALYSQRWLIWGLLGTRSGRKTHVLGSPRPEPNWSQIYPLMMPQATWKKAKDVCWLVELEVAPQGWKAFPWLQVGPTAEV